MKYYEIKMYGLVQFDYCGEDEFFVKIFKNTAIQPNYRKMCPSKFLGSEKCRNWKKTEYIVDDTSLEFQKAVAIWSFNAFMDYVDYLEMKIGTMHIDGELPYLVSSVYIIFSFYYYYIFAIKLF